MRVFHVTSTKNRGSILSYGLDWTRMGDATGIAGSTAPEQSAIFLCRDESEMRWFVQMNNTGGPVDVWAVDDVDQTELQESPEGYECLRRSIPLAQVSLLYEGIEPGATVP